jgi:uncharacterized protein YydD (DUF2326 family)
MIISVRANNPSFREVKFTKGFNVILAERTKESSDKDSCNGLGKTTLIEIIHFCLGSQPKEEEGIFVDHLKDWEFILDITLGSKKYTISRSINDSGIVKLIGDFSNWPIKPSYDSEKNSYLMKVSDWVKVLGFLMFDISPNVVKKYHPTFRSLISYFIRRGPEAFHDSFKNYPQQMIWDIQVANSFLLGLNWEYPAQLQIIKDNEKVLQNLKTAASQGLLTGFLGTKGELEAIKVSLEEKTKELEKELTTFKVHPKYYEISEDANKLTKQIKIILNDINISQKILQNYNDSLISEKDVPVEKIERVYKESGMLFSDSIKKTLQDVLKFHEKLIENRKKYLENETFRIIRKVELQKKEIENLSNKKSELLTVLKTHGALDDYTKLQNILIKLRAELEEINNRISNFVKFDEGKSSLKIEKEELLQKIRRDYEERNEIIRQAILLFNKNSQALYSEPGTLSIDITDSGYKFKVDIKRERSQGIGYMKTFCYDLMLIELRLKIRDSPGFLIHDSTIFDGVDGRQIAKAMELAAKESEDKDFQYICAINSDNVPYDDFSIEFKERFENFVRIKLTDAKEDGGLLGFRF